MESKVEMTLEEYTNLIGENERLKSMLRTCHRQLEEKAKGSVDVYIINGLTKEQCGEAIKMDEKLLIHEYTYGRTFNDAIMEFPCFKINEIKNVFIETILKKIKGRMADLKDEE